MSATFEKIIVEPIQQGSAMKVYVWNHLHPERLVFTSLMIVSNPEGGNMQEIEFCVSTVQTFRSNAHQGIAGAELDLKTTINHNLATQGYELKGEVVVRDPYFEEEF